jgi:hypothetical protein
MGRNALDILAKHGIEVTEEDLEHSGVKGMRWGRRKKRDSEDDDGPPKPSIKDLTDDELRSKINRLKMEKEFASLTAREVNVGKKIVGGILLDIGKQIAKEYVTSKANQRIYGHPGGIKAALAAAEAATKAVTK